MMDGNEICKNVELEALKEGILKEAPILVRNAVYSGTRNLYPDMVNAAKSLVANSAVDTVWFLIEDEKFPFELPEIVRTIDVSDICNQVFIPNGPNSKSPFTHMAMIRACYPTVLPYEVHKVLQLDVDTVVVDNIDDIWTMLDRKDKWVAAVHETLGKVRTYGRVYLNAGFMYLDLDKMCTLKIEEQAVEMLNTQAMPYIDQDAICKLAVDTKGYLKLPKCYNECFVTSFTEEPKVIHYAGNKAWQTSPAVPRREYLKKYREMSWEEALKCNSEAKSRLTR